MGTRSKPACGSHTYTSHGFITAGTHVGTLTAAWPHAGGPQAMVKLQKRSSLHVQNETKGYFKVTTRLAPYILICFKA
jgi:hypothetical protein